MSMLTMVKVIKQIHPKDIVLFKMGSFYHTYSKVTSNEKIKKELVQY